MLEIVSTWEFWLIMAAICVVLELLTNTFALFAIAGGCLVAVLLHFLEMGLAAQIVGMCCGAVITFICFKPLVRRHLRSKEPEYKSNIDALVGRETIALQDADESGITRVRIDGDNWQARSENECCVKKGDKLRVTGYDSIILIVEKLL